MDVPTLVTGIKFKHITVSSILTPSFLKIYKNHFQSVKCGSTYTIVCSDENVISFWGTRYGIPQKSDNLSSGYNSSSSNKPTEFDQGNSTAAFTNFLTSVYKTEKILDPIDILA